MLHLGYLVRKLISVSNVIIVDTHGKFIRFTKEEMFNYRVNNTNIYYIIYRISNDDSL